MYLVREKGQTYMTMKNLLESFRRHMNEAELEEATRASKEGVKLPSTLEQLEPYVVSDDETPTHFFQFSNVNKLGVNPSSKFNTPMGIYAYPLIKTLFDQYKMGHIPFASDRKYTIVFKTKPGSNILVAGVPSGGGAYGPISDKKYISMAKLLYTKEAATLTGNPSFYEEAAAYKTGDIFSNEPEHPFLDQTRQEDWLDEIADKFFDWLAGALSPEVLNHRWADLLDEIDQAAAMATFKRSRKEYARSVLWDILIYTIKDWASYPYEQASEYNKLVKDFRNLLGKEKIRRLKDRATSMPRSTLTGGSKEKQRYNSYVKDLTNLEALFTKKHYDMVILWLGRYMKEQGTVFDDILELMQREVRGHGAAIALDSAALHALKIPPHKYHKPRTKKLELKDIAALNKALIKNSWEQKSPNNKTAKHSRNPEEMTSSWHEMERDMLNKTNLGKLWYGSMMLARNRSYDFDRSSRHGMKVWRTILQRLWGIDGIVDMGSVGPWTGSSVLIHKSEPTQAVFFSKSALEHVTTLKNTETPKALKRRKQGQIRKIQKMLASSVKREWNEIYAGIIEDWSSSEFLKKRYERKKKLLLGADVIINNLISWAPPELSNKVLEESWWKVFSNITLDEMDSYSAAVDHSVEPMMMHVREQLSKEIFEEWHAVAMTVIFYKIKEIYGGTEYSFIGLPHKQKGQLMTYTDNILNEIHGFSKPTTHMLKKEDLIAATRKMTQLHDSINKMYLSRLTSLLAPGLSKDETLHADNKVVSAANDFLKSLK